MDQNKIVEALQKALANGTGSLDDLDNLLKRAREDVDQAKKNAAEAAKKAEAKRGEDVAKIATRMLNSELTDEDMAFIMNTFFMQHKLNGCWTADSIKHLMTECNDRHEKADQEVKKAVNELCNFFNDIFNLNLNPKELDVKVEKPAAKPKCDCNKTDPDVMIQDFLKKYGLA